MALYKDTHRCHKCGETFTWYYQPEQESYLQVVHDDGKSAAVKGILLVTEQIYSILVDCPYCGAQNDFNCKIEQELPGFPEKRIVTEMIIVGTPEGFLSKGLERCCLYAV